MRKTDPFYQKFSITNCSKKNQNRMEGMLLRKASGVVKNEREAHCPIRRPHVLSNCQITGVGHFVSIPGKCVSSPQKRCKAILTVLCSEERKAWSSSQAVKLPMACLSPSHIRPEQHWCWLTRQKDYSASPCKLTLWLMHPHLWTVSFLSTLPDDLCLEWVTLLPS
jgi:hypothetical protein